MSARDPVIIGVAQAPTIKGRVPGWNALEIQARCAKAALAESGLGFKEINGLFSAGMWGVPGAGSMMTLTLAEYLGISNQIRLLDGTQIGGSSFEAHTAHAALAIQAGYCETALITYGSTQRSLSERSLGGRAPAFTLQFETPYGMPTPVGAYAMAAMRHMHQYGTTSEQLAEIAVATRAWASLNPEACYREPLRIDDVLNSQMITSPLHLLDCCLITDGGGAVIMTTEERAKDLPVKPIYVRGYAETTTHATIQAMDDVTITGAARTGPLAMEMAGITHGDIDVAEIYDSFTITVLLTLESLGFCKAGEGGDFVSKQRTAPGGDFPMNTNGGGLSFCHPGMYGIFLLIEAVRQLRGEAGERQIKNAPKIALVHGTGGVLSSTATCILTTS